jgi:hypothetical protein
MNTEPREPYVKGQLIVWFVKDKEIDKNTIQEICDNCGVEMIDFHNDRCRVKFDEKDVDAVMEKLYGWPEYIKNTSRNYYVYLRG